MPEKTHEKLARKIVAKYADCILGPPAMARELLAEDIAAALSRVREETLQAAVVSQCEARAAYGALCAAAARKEEREANRRGERLPSLAAAPELPKEPIG